MGVSYQGVYDKRYIAPITEKIDADIYVMTRFLGGQFHENFSNKNAKWGYETKMYNARSGEQKVSIHAAGLNSYSEVENHVRDHVEKLSLDIQSFAKSDS
jgi:hypothetical protein